MTATALALLARRLLTALPIMLVVAALVFTVLRLLPADPLGMSLPPNASQADVAQMRQEMGFDRPIAAQFGIWLQHLAEGDLGTSIHFRRRVAAMILTALPTTLELVAAGLEQTDEDLDRYPLARSLKAALAQPGAPARLLDGWLAVLENRPAPVDALPTDAAAATTSAVATVQAAAAAAASAAQQPAANQAPPAGNTVVPATTAPAPAPPAPTEPPPAPAPTTPPPAQETPAAPAPAPSSDVKPTSASLRGKRKRAVPAAARQADAAKPGG